MRLMLVKAQRERGAKVLEIAERHEGTNLAQFEGKDSYGLHDLVFIQVPNGKVEELLEDLEPLPQLYISFLPYGTLALNPPSSEIPEQTINVETLSPVEVFLKGLQSVGTWKGFVEYAAVAGVVVWIGLYTNTIFLLIAAMLLAPFAGPAMNIAIASARGDLRLLGRSLLRYFVALAITGAVAAGLSLIFQQQVATILMIQTSHISSVAVLLPLAAGAAGALHLVQSERSSLVSGASVGVLVAAALAPPTGIVGMSLAMAKWEMVYNGLFLLILQLVGINLAGALTFRAYGLKPRGARYKVGRRWLFPVVMAATVLGLAGLLMLQFSYPPNLQRLSRAQSATEEVQKVLDESDLAQLVEAQVRFTGPEIKGQNTLLGVIFVQRRAGVAESSDEIREKLTHAIQRRLLDKGFKATPLMDVVVLSAPARE